MEAPEHVLPPITSSQTGTKSAASAIARVVSGGPKPPAITRESMQESAPAVPARSEAEHLTLAELEQRVVGKTTTPAVQTPPEIDEGWSAGDLLRKSVPQVRKTGASLAGAALKGLKR